MKVGTVHLVILEYWSIGSSSASALNFRAYGDETLRAVRSVEGVSQACERCLFCCQELGHSRCNYMLTIVARLFAKRRAMRQVMRQVKASAASSAPATLCYFEASTSRLHTQSSNLLRWTSQKIAGSLFILLTIRSIDRSQMLPHRPVQINKRP